MEPRFETVKEKKLAGMRLTMSLSVNKTQNLWQNFMKRRKEIVNPNGNELYYSVQIYRPSYFDNFDPANEFEKWAAVEVPDGQSVPDGFEKFVLPPGLYAVFIHRGASSTGAQTFGRIFGTWLPASGYALDNRPHFELLGEKYKNDDPSSEEEIWIPVVRK